MLPSNIEDLFNREHDKFKYDVIISIAHKEWIEECNDISWLIEIMPAGLLDSCIKCSYTAVKTTVLYHKVSEQIIAGK